jgi:hypothetical protein
MHSSAALLVCSVQEIARGIIKIAAKKSLVRSGIRSSMDDVGREPPTLVGTHGRDRRRFRIAAAAQNASAIEIQSIGLERECWHDDSRVVVA